MGLNKIKLILNSKLLCSLIVAFLLLTTTCVLTQQVALSEEIREMHNGNSITSAIGQGVEIVWDSTYGGSDDDWAFDVIECANGGFLIGAITYSFGSGWGDIWLIRIDDEGTPQWSRTYGDINGEYGDAIIELDDGSFVIAGYTNSIGAGGYDAWLLCVDENGNHQWNQTFGGPGNDWCFDAIKCSTNGFALVGTTENFGASGRDMWLIRTDSVGNLLWNRTYGGSGTEYGRSLVECDGGGFVLAGHTNSYGSGEKDAWLVRVNSSGNLIWSHTFGNVGNDEAYSIVKTNSNGYAFLGSTVSIVSGGQQLWLVEIDDDGDLVWQKEYGGDGVDYGYALEKMGENYLLGGSLSASSNDFFLVCTNSSGNQIWSEHWGGSNGDGCEGLVYCSDGSIVLAGHTWSYGAGGGDVWVIGVDDNSPPEWINTPHDVQILSGHFFQYNLGAADESGIDKYWLNDTLNFSVNDIGLIDNATPLPDGIYGVQLWVNDTFDNILTTTFTLTVGEVETTATSSMTTTTTIVTTTSTGTPQIYLPKEFLIYGLVLIIVVATYYVLKRKF